MPSRAWRLFFFFRARAQSGRSVRVWKTANGRRRLEDPSGGGTVLGLENGYEVTPRWRWSCDIGRTIVNRRIATALSVSREWTPLGRDSRAPIEPAAQPAIMIVAPPLRAARRDDGGEIHGARERAEERQRDTPDRAELDVIFRRRANPSVAASLAAPRRRFTKRSVAESRRVVPHVECARP